MKLSSPSFANGDMIPMDYTCEGRNINPPLIIEDVPKDAISLALVVEDLDSEFSPACLWLMYDLDTHTKNIKEGKAPRRAKYGNNHLGFKAYAGPCVTPHIHRYRFRLLAFDHLLDNIDKQNATVIRLEQEYNKHGLSEAKLIGIYYQPLEYKKRKKNIKKTVRLTRARSKTKTQTKGFKTRGSKVKSMAH